MDGAGRRSANGRNGPSSRITTSASLSPLGVVLMFLMWVARNIPTGADVEWFKSGGGMFGGEDARRRTSSTAAKS